MEKSGNAVETLNTGEQNKIEPTKSTFHCAKEFRCARNISFKDLFKSDIFRPVDTRRAPGMIAKVQQFFYQATVVLKFCKIMILSCTKRKPKKSRALSIQPKLSKIWKQRQMVQKFPGKVSRNSENC